jgi:hypothetical protein
MKIRSAAKTPTMLPGILAVWLVIALIVGQAQLLTSFPVFAAPIIVFSLVGAVLLALWKVPALRNWIFDINIRALLLLHVTRFVGIYFLILYGRGVLPYEMVQAGWGDILVAATALLVFYLPMRGATSWYSVCIWNCIGLLDIIFVVTTPLRLVLEGPHTLPSLTQFASAMTKLPLSLLPTFLVPLIIASHIVIFIRLNRSRKSNFATL